jgi:hypothetical protein
VTVWRPRASGPIQFSRGVSADLARCAPLAAPVEEGFDGAILTERRRARWFADARRW